jgi:hypothetical protein
MPLLPVKLILPDNLVVKNRTSGLMGKTTQDISTGLYHVQIRYTSESVKIANPYTPLSAGAIHSRLKRRPQWAGPLASSMYWGLLNFPVPPRFS